MIMIMVALFHSLVGGVCSCQGVRMEVRGQLAGFDSLFLPYALRVLNSEHHHAQPWVSLPAEPSPQSSFSFILMIFIIFIHRRVFAGMYLCALYDAQGGQKRALDPMGPLYLELQKVVSCQEGAGN